MQESPNAAAQLVVSRLTKTARRTYPPVVAAGIPGLLEGPHCRDQGSAGCLDAGRESGHAAGAQRAQPHQIDEPGEH
jgi:hypothetical protein